MFTMVPRFQTASEEALGSCEGENVKPAGWAPQTLGGGELRAACERTSWRFHTPVCPGNDNAGDGDWCAGQLCLARGRAGCSSVRAWALPHQLRLVFQHLASSRPPECLSRFSKLLNLRDAGRYRPTWPQHCPWSWVFDDMSIPKVSSAGLLYAQPRFIQRLPSECGQNSVFPCPGAQCKRPRRVG